MLMVTFFPYFHKCINCSMRDHREPFYIHLHTTSFSWVTTFSLFTGESRAINQTHPTQLHTFISESEHATKHTKKSYASQFACNPDRQLNLFKLPRPMFEPPVAVVHQTQSHTGHKGQRVFIKGLCCPR